MADSTPPKPSKNLLAALGGKGKKKKLRKTQTKVRDRQGNIHIEERGNDGTVIKKQVGKQNEQKTAEKYSDVLKAFEYHSDIKRWQAYVYDADKYSTDEKKNSNDTDESDSKSKPVLDSTPKVKKLEDKHLRIMSYNIWFADQEWQERQSHLLSMIKEYSPHIICLQEVTPRFMVGFCDNVFIQSNYVLSSNKVGTTLGQYGVMIAVNKNEIGVKQFIKNKFIQINEKDNSSMLLSRMGRWLLTAELDLGKRYNNETLWINTVHLESMNSTQARIKQMDLIFNKYMKNVCIRTVFILCDSLL